MGFQVRDFIPDKPLTFKSLEYLSLIVLIDLSWMAEFLH